MEPKKRKRVEMYADIGGWGYTPAMMSEQLASGEEIDLHINSPGGSITDGIAIFNQIRSAVAAGREVVAHIDGLAASMASVIACACSKIVMYRNSYLMIHNPWTVSIGDAEQLRHDASLLDSFKARMIESYQSKFDLSTEEIDKLLDNETWISGADAAGAKLKAEIIDDDIKAAASVKGRMSLNLPAAAKAFYQQEIVNAEPAIIEPAKADPITTAGTDTGASAAEEDCKPVGEVGAEVKLASAPVLNENQASIDTAQAVIDARADAKAARDEVARLVARVEEMNAAHKAELVKRDELISKHQSEADKAKADLKKRTEEADSLRAKLHELLAPATSFTPEQKPVATFAEALKACGGDYVKARKEYADLWAKTVNKQKSK
jgi:ATP-dependent protease ClpP protease subunit